MTNGTPCPRAFMENAEPQFLCTRATRSTDPRAIHREHPQEPDDFRTEFQRDYTRIIHCRTFRRLRHKTQVFISPQNDHLCTRLEHSLHVASVAGTVAQALRLNVELVRAIAIGHDLGHAPFGHKGEASLQDIAREHGLSFSHELHSLRVVDFLESPYPNYRGLNLTFAVRDGIVCHHGESFERSLAPDRKKPLNALTTTARGRARPATLEGCVARWADKVAYLGRDLEDALALKMIRERDIPRSVSRVLGKSNREIIAGLIRELVRHGIEDDCLAVGASVHEALNELHRFSEDHIYRAAEATRPFGQIERAMKTLFTFLLEHMEDAKGDTNRIRATGDPTLASFAKFLDEDIPNWQRKAPAQLVIDFIAGMTDSYFVNTFVKLFLPQNAV